jgi:ribosomal protein S18 acetylase RimI-like enzyme
MTHRRVPMEIALVRQSIDGQAACRNPRPADELDLAILLYAAYRGTIDDEGGTFADARAEVEGLLAGTYGEFLSACSFVVEEGEFLVSASLITWWEPHGAPLVAFTMTRPEARNRGLARRVLKASMNALLDRGHDRLTLVVTDGNAPAQHLYASLGFREIAPPS